MDKPEEDECFVIAPQEVPRVGEKYRFGKHVIHVRGVVDDQVVYRRWYANRYEYFVCPAWMFKPSLSLMEKLKEEKNAEGG